MKTTAHYHARALIAERSSDVPREVLVLGPQRPLVPGSASILVLVRVLGEAKPMWIAKERLLVAGIQPDEERPEEERPEMTREAAPRVPGGVGA